MNENINLIEILKDCPKGATLWCSVYGYCSFEYISILRNDCPIYVKYKNGNFITFTKEGKLYCEDMSDTECVLFPSKEQRDWSKFVVPKEDLSLNNNTVKIRAWVARNEWGNIHLYRNKPFDIGWKSPCANEIICLPDKSFPEVKSSDLKPVEVEVTVKIKNQ